MAMVSDLSVVRAMQDGRSMSRREEELRQYLRWEYHGGDGEAFVASARAGRAKSAGKAAGRVSRAFAGLASAVAAVFGQPGGA